MVQLQPRQLAQVVSMFDGDPPNRPMLESVLADRNPGGVLADFAERATAARTKPRPGWRGSSGIAESGGTGSGSRSGS
jgi:hypothetical protein